MLGANFGKLSMLELPPHPRLLSGATPVTDLLALAAARTVTAWRRHRGQDTPTPLLAIETHGRADELVEQADTGRGLGEYREPQLLLNYLGRIHTGGDLGALKPERALLAGVSPAPEPDLAVRHELTLAVGVLPGADGPILVSQWRMLPDIFRTEDVNVL
ncbi:hypothetical protein BH09ACT7_BH09ACT7_10650 [soil metagenome]